MNSPTSYIIAPCLIETAEWLALQLGNAVDDIGVLLIRALTSLLYDRTDPQCSGLGCEEVVEVYAEGRF